MKDNETRENIEQKEQGSGQSRREFLKKASAFAIYTPPAITMLMNPSRASMTKSPGGHHHRYNDDHGRRRNRRPKRSHHRA